VGFRFIYSNELELQGLMGYFTSWIFF